MVRATLTEAKNVNQLRSEVALALHTPIDVDGRVELQRRSDFLLASLVEDMVDGTEMLPLSRAGPKAGALSRSASHLASSASKAMKSTSAVLERTSQHSEGGLLQVMSSLLP